MKPAPPRSGRPDEYLSEISAILPYWTYLKRQIDDLMGRLLTR